MGNTCQTSHHLAPSAYLAEFDDKKSQPSKPHQQPDNHAIQSKIKPITFVNSGRHSKSTTASETKRCNKNFSKLYLRLDDKPSQQIMMRRNLSKTGYISTLDLDLDLRSNKLALGKQFRAFVSSLKHFRKIPNLQIDYGDFPYENNPQFCFALKHIKAPKKLNVHLCYNRYSREHKPETMIQALKRCQDLREISVELASIENLKPKPLEQIFSSLKRHKNLKALSVKGHSLTHTQLNAFNKAMNNLCRLKLSKITFHLSENSNSDAFKELFVIITNFAPSLQHLSLWLGLTNHNSDAFSQHLSKFAHLSHLQIRGYPHAADANQYIENLMSGLKSMQNLPANFKVGSGFPWEDQNLNVNRQAFIRLYSKLASEKWNYIVKFKVKEANSNLCKCYLQNIQPHPDNFSGLQIDFKDSDRIDELVDLLNQVNLSQELFIELSKVDISGLQKIFASLKTFPSLKRFTISFTRCYQINSKWIEGLFDLLVKLPVVFLKLVFVECIQLTPQDVQFITSSLARHKKMKNLTGFGLNFVDIIQFTDENGTELANELKQMTHLTNLELSFKGCYMLKDQGVISLIENVKALPRLKRGRAQFEDCWYIEQSTIDTYQMETENFSIKFANCKEGSQ